MQLQQIDNRVSKAVARIQAKLDKLDPEKLAELEKGNNITFDEHFYYQTVQSRAHAAGRISVVEASILYQALGVIRNDSNGGWAKDTDLATKLAVTLVVGELA